MRAACCEATVLRNEVIAPDIRLLTVVWPDRDHAPHAGQFFTLRSWGADEAPFLSRPISVHRWNPDSSTIEFLYQVVGEGTEKLAQLKQQDTFQLTGPMGNGFDVPDILSKYKKIAVVGGGIGTAPMFQLTRELAAAGVKPDVFFGFRDTPYCMEEYRSIANLVKVSTDTGAVGFHGFVTQLYDPADYDVVLVCGPTVMMQNAARLCAENGVAPEQVRAVFLGVAGGSHAGFCALTNEKLHRLFPNAKTAVSHDAVNIVYAAFPEEDGAAVICGTGCSCYVRKGDVLHRIGGYSIFDVAGNGYEIGKRAVSHALACVDGRAEPDALYALVRDYTGEDLLDALPRLLRSSKTEIARYAPLVFEAERRGSAAAGIILRENIARIAEYINAAARYFDASFPAAIAGGIFRDARAMELLLPMLRCDCRVSVLTREPVCGAAEKARRLLTNG